VAVRQLTSYFQEAIDRIQSSIKSLPLGKSSNSISNLAPIDILLRSFSEDESLRRCLLKLLEHPSATLASCARDTLAFERSNYWLEQRDWFSELPSKCGDKIVLKNVDEMKPLAYSPYWIILKLLYSLRSHCRSTCIQRDIFSAIPAKYFAVTFKVIDDQTGKLVDARHFIKFFLELDRVEFAITMADNNFRAAVSDEFFRALFEEALKIIGGCHIVAQMAVEMLFKKKEFYENDFCPEFIENIPNFVPCVVEEIYKASGDLFTSDPDPCKLIVTFILRLEDCASRSTQFRDAYIVTLTDWITSDLETKKQRMDMVKSIFDELQIHKYVYELLSPLIKSFFPGLLGSESGSPPQSTKTARLNYSKERMAEILMGLMITSAVAHSHSFALLLSMENTILKTFLAQGEQFRQK